tara:strand:+ start:1119 stop:1526 length:408 start_codon:yes stop_codon:yes gene_type:complete
MKLRLLVDPVPASRPRFVKRGNYTSTYYAGRYKDFLQETGPVAVEQALRDTGSLDFDLPIEQDVAVDILFLVKRPKTTKLSTPKGDVDNYGKAALDLLQLGGVLLDDKFVSTLHLEKRFTTGQPCLEIEITRARS